MHLLLFFFLSAEWICEICFADNDRKMGNICICNNNHNQHAIFWAPSTGIPLSIGNLLTLDAGIFLCVLYLFFLFFFLVFGFCE